MKVLKIVIYNEEKKINVYLESFFFLLIILIILDFLYENSLGFNYCFVFIALHFYSYFRNIYN